MDNTLRKLRGLNFAPRWSSQPMIRREYVVEHSYWVALYSAILAYMWNIYGDNRPLNIIDAMMAGALHDAEEATTGDLPALAKRRIPEAWQKLSNDIMDETFDTTGEFGSTVSWLKLCAKMSHGSSTDEYNLTIAKIVKAADLLSALMYLKEEETAGNSYVHELIVEIAQATRQIELPGLHELLDRMAFMPPPRPKDFISHL